VREERRRDARNRATRAAKAARGFTLFEIILVCLLVATLAAIVAPSFSGVNARSRLDSTARAVVALARAARSRASSDGRAYFLVLDAPGREIRLARQRDPLVAPTAEADAETDGDDWTGGAPWAKSVQFEDGVDLVAANIATLDIDLNQQLPIRIAFNPDGTSDDAWMDLQGEGQVLLRLRVDFASGRTRILTNDERDADIAGVPPPLPTPVGSQ